MRLQPGSRLGSYQIVSALGVGGMGEVYRARDSNLNRDVALKVLPDAFASDPDRLARFTREAQALAALNHPQILHVYGLEQHQDGDVSGAATVAIVMELVEGEDLAQRIARGAIPFDEALPIARQIAEAIEAAHEQGIIHRDLKPANVKLRSDGAVKVLDFGLAKAFESSLGSSADLSTRAAAAHTQQGMILGTAAYMSPEQARGSSVDKRTDIWAFGCVLYEMLTGRAAFAGATFTDTAAAVIGRAPDWHALPSNTPPDVRRLLQRCLEKESRQRLRDIGDARIELTRSDRVEPIDATRLGQVRRVRTAPVVAGAALLGLIVGTIAGGYALRSRLATGTKATPIRFSLAPPEGGDFGREPPTSFMAVSPDGSNLAFVANTPTGRFRIWVRPISGLDARAVPGTEGGRSPFFSPDGTSLAFFSNDQLKRVNLTGGSPIPVCDVKNGLRMNGTWGTAGTIVFGAADGSAILSVNAAGGTPEIIVAPDRSRRAVRVNWPWFLPDGKRFIYLTRLEDGSGQLRITERGGTPRPILSAVSNAQWVDPDYLVFARDGVLLGQRYDLAAERLVGEPFSIAEPVDYHYTIARAMFATSRNGTLAYHSHEDLSRLAWIDRAGREVGAVGRPGGYQNLRLSPDGTTVLFDRAMPGSGSWDLWTTDLARGVETRLTSERGAEVTPVWVLNGRGVAFGADRGGPPHLYWKDLSTGVEEELRPAGRQQQALDVTPDGNTIVFSERSGSGIFDLFTMPLRPSSTPAALIGSPFDKMQARLSPDGHAVAFTATDTGAIEVYLAPTTARAARITVSGGGVLPRWTRDNRELFYLTTDRRLMSVPVRTTPALAIGTPTPLFELPPRREWNDFDVSPDGKRFLAVIPEVIPSTKPMSIVLNWTAEVHR